MIIYGYLCGHYLKQGTLRVFSLLGFLAGGSDIVDSAAGTGPSSAAASVHICDGVPKAFQAR